MPIPTRAKKIHAAVLAVALGLSTLANARNDEVFQLIQKLRSSDKRAASAAAQELGQHRYHEVVEALIDAARKELEQATPNTYVLKAAIVSAGVLATPQEIPELDALRRTLDAQLSSGTGGGSLRYIGNDLEQAIANARGRSETHLARLIPAASGSGAKKGMDRPLLREVFQQASVDSKIPGDAKQAIEVVQTGTGSKGFLSDEIQEQIRKNDQFEIFGREKEMEQVIDVLTREKGKNPILIGPRGAGKTTIAQKVARAILEEDLPKHNVFQDELSGAYVLETSPARISRLAKSDSANAQAAALELYFDSILTLEEKLGVKIVLFIDEIHTLDGAQVEAMKPYLDSRTKAIKLIGASTSVEYQNAFKNNPAIQRRFDTIGVAEQSVEEVKKIIVASEKSRAEKRYGFKILDEAIDVIIENANRVYPDTSRVDGAAKLLMTVCTSEARRAGERKAGRPLEITDRMVYRFIQEKLNYPADPLDVKGLRAYRENLLSRLNEEVIGQDRMATDIVDEWIKVQRQSGKGVRTAVVLGPTGVGKSLMGRELARAVFGSEGAFLEVDGNQFKEGSISTNTFFGAPNGVLSSDKTSGMLFDYLDDPGRGKHGGIVLINEPERAHTDFWEKMMEILDTGRGTGGDGKERILNRHLIIFASNRGDRVLFPRTLETWTDEEYQAHLRTLTEERLKSAFTEASSGRDEFRLPDAVLARIDRYTAAEPMTLAKSKKVAVQKARKALEKIEKTFKIAIEFDPRVAETIAEASYQPGFGARSVEKKATSLMEEALEKFLAEHDTNRGDRLSVSLVGGPTAPKISVSKGKSVSELEIPIHLKVNALEDPAFLARLEGLGAEARKTIFGQEEMIDRILDAVIAHRASEAKRPLSFFVVGATGTGKTEIAKVVAKALYGSTERALILDMGKVIYEGEFNDIFGSPAGHVGSQDERIFEKFLRENPQGGVVALDEISNMGGKDPAQKEALFKKLYAIFEEGKWTSPATGKTYDLSKYTILSTGNDLEKLLQGVSADDLRLAIWNKNKNPAQVRALLRKAGVPEAFLGRMADVILAKPLLKKEVEQIAIRMLTEQAAALAAKGIRIRYEDSFVADIAAKFFSQDQGARSIRNLIEHRVQSAITQLVIKVGGPKNLADQTVHLSLEDSQVKRTFVKATDPERQVTLQARLGNQANAPTVKLDVTEFATRTNLSTLESMWRTAFHEAGHAVVNIPALTGERVALITVVGQDQYMGYARYEELISGIHPEVTERTVVAEMSRLLAGQMAEKLAGYGPSAGWANDLEKARSLASRYLLEWGMGENLASVPLDAQGRPRLTGTKRSKFQREMDRLFKEAGQQAERALEENWSLVRAIVAELHKKGEIRGARLEEITAQVRANPGKKWVRHEGRLVNERCRALLFR